MDRAGVALLGWAWVLARMVTDIVLPADRPEAELAASRRRFLAWVSAAATWPWP